MKHVTPNEADQLLDLGKPSLEALSFMLRHREMWPAGFEWRWAKCETCAMGLACRLWTKIESPNTENIGDVLNIHQRDAKYLFTRIPDTHRTSDAVSPDSVADQIDAYLTDLKSA